ncbi:acyl carrier protein [Crocosphaera sp. UHCC 0190]|uniref:acyl carrier protein n=1 Tax=Crocosphaera sp. UHCC 0190 TaxID=3110246 RepID=UPI002B20E488|nr:acyl carrier protein [Crocosphaera sp. UHCC 0190]MEA5510552.1 acyl carrier protein [Crocosphaera sp. UHCC 0190]
MSSSLQEQEVQQVVKKHIAEQFMYDKPEVNLDNDLPLIEQGIIDSVGIFQMISFLEDKFQVILDPDEVLLENFETVSAISSFVIDKLSPQN